MKKKDFITFLVGMLCGGAVGYFIGKSQEENYLDDDLDYEEDEDYFEDEEVAEDFDADAEYESKGEYEEKVSQCCRCHNCQK